MHFDPERVGHRDVLRMYRAGQVILPLTGTIYYNAIHFSKPRYMMEKIIALNAN